MIEIVRDKKTLAAIANEWNRLANPFGTPLMCHEWFVACAEALHADGDLCVVVLRSSDRAVAIAPLALARRHGIEYLEFLGGSVLYEPCGFLYDSESTLFKLLEAVLTLRRPLVLQRMALHSGATRLLHEISKRQGIFVKRATASSAYVPIESRWDAFTKLMSSRRRYDLRRARRRAEEKGKITVEIFCPSIEGLETHLERAFHIEAAGWKGEKGSALLTNQKLGHFFRTYSTLACKKGALRLCFLYVDGEAVAMQLGVVHSNRFWVLKIGYDEKWARCSPGIQLTHETIRYAFENGLRSYEFLGSDEPWLYAWPVDLRNYISTGVYPVTFHGLLGLGLDGSGFVMRKLAGGLARIRTASHPLLTEQS